MDKCLNCKKNIGFYIEFGGGNIIPWGVDGDGFLCSNKCYKEYQEKVNQGIIKIAKMSNREFYNWMGVKN